MHSHLGHTTMENGDRRPQHEQRIFRTLKEDLFRGGIPGSVHREFQEVKEYMLDEQRRRRLTHMSRWTRWFYTWLWILKSMFYKLTPARRVFLTLGILLVFMSRTSFTLGGSGTLEIDTTIPGVLIILLILTMELKDKLLAREELEAGRAVQHALMPERSPELPGWQLWLFTRSANEVGGDLVDFVSVNDERYGVVLGDVAGKGLSAALLMVRLQATLKAIVADFVSLGDLGQKLNLVFCRDCLPSIFASMVYLELKPHSGVVNVLNAGHMPPVVVRGATLESLPKGGAALGLTDQAIYASNAITLAPNDILAAYSDGVTEAQSPAGEFFGEERLFEFLAQHGSQPIAALGEDLVKCVDAFIAGGRCKDDLSIALLRRIEG